MANEENKKKTASKAKTSAAKKTTGTVKKTTATAPKTNTAKKPTVTKKAAPKPVEPKKEIIKEEKSAKEIELELEKEAEILELRQKRFTIQAIIIGVVMFFVLLAIVNKTFIGTTFKNDYIKVDIPRFTYYWSDSKNTVKLVTLRKSAYLREYFEEYLEGFTFYNCNNGKNIFYYNESNQSVIREINIKKNIVGIKTIEIVYEKSSPSELCGFASTK